MHVATYLVTFVVFLMEAFLHFNLGKYGSISLSQLSLPDKQEMFDIIKVLAVFSAINAYLVPIVTEWMEGKPLENTASSLQQDGKIKVG